MSGFDLTPQGDDGESIEDSRYMQLAIGAFKGMVLAVDQDDTAMAHAIWQDMVEQVAGSVHPHGLLIQVALMFNAFLLRNMAGDPSPTSPPHGHLTVTVVGWNKETETLVDNPLADFAANAIVRAANWEWDKLNDLLESGINEASDRDQFLHDLAALLMSMFIGVGGIDQTGWRS